MQGKRIGATAHPVTEVLDDAPIIKQSMERISHRDALEVLMPTECHIGEAVRSRAERWHIESRILLYKNMTVIFER